jgi:hypothetical protein
MQCAGARASQAEIGLMRRQQRHKSNPEYGPENHLNAFSRLASRPCPAARCGALSSFFKFEASLAFRIEQETQACRFAPPSIQNRGAIDPYVTKIFAKVE